MDEWPSAEVLPTQSHPRQLTLSICSIIIDGMDDRLSHVPVCPGVYLLKDRRGRVIYVGKAKNLRERLKTHFANSTPDHPRLSLLRERQKDFEFITTASEVEALILEANLIKLHLPKYNVRLKDDKKYPYIKVTLDEEYPRVFPTRNLKRNGWIFFGPYTNVKSMRKALRVVKKIFPLRTCKQKLPSKTKASPCLNYYIKKCPAPCQGHVSKEEYRELVREVCRILCGKSKAVEEELEKKMLQASRDKRFEEAAGLRDQLRAVRETVRRQRVVFDDEADRDVLGLFGGTKETCLAVLQIRDGKLVGQEHYMLSTGEGIEEAEILHTFLQQYYKNSYFIPDEILLPNSVQDAGLLSEWLSAKKEKKVRLVVPRRGEKKKVVESARRNAMYFFRQESSAVFKERIPFSVTELEKELVLQRTPRLIEAFDVSTLFGSDACGSLVVFRDGRPRKSEYRRFKIRSVVGMDDYAMMRELVHRRYRKVIDRHMELPDLVLIDGGPGQLRSARETLAELGVVDVPVFGLAKRLDEIVSSDGKTIMLPKSSYALRLLQQVRDEAHRFAVGYHRRLRASRLRKSSLDSIPGLGWERKRALLRQFGSVEALRSAPVEEIIQVSGVGPVLASRIYSHFHPD